MEQKHHVLFIPKNFEICVYLLALNSSTNMEPGDAVFVTTHVHNQQQGIISHVTTNKTLYIYTTTKQRIRILQKDINKCVKLINKRNPKEIISPTALQESISKLLNENYGNALIGLR